jgi:CRISPR-associated endonuclease/helicase Cas3
MRELRPSDFADFFDALHGCRPFPWQMRLLEQLAKDGQWPGLLDLPTGSGKTAALDCAVFHLALEAGRGSERRAATRICFVVDRRMVVDDVFSRAERISKALAKPEAELVRRVGAALSILSEIPGTPVVACRLRGGVPLESDPFRSPSQPMIICSTVDQVGSRLLFRGYGVSDRMAPIHAGLLGADCLFLLDEAHLARPFDETLESVSVLRRRRQISYASPPWSRVLLSATPGDQKSDRSVFSIHPEDRANPVLKRRLEASKPAQLVEIALDRMQTLVDLTHAALGHFASRGLQAPAIGIVVNRVARARMVYEALKEFQPGTIDIELVIGPSRPLQRQEVATRLAPIKTGAPQRGLMTRPLVIVATQTIEAGVDLDLDGLITEVASLDALRQRFGRLNRSGRPNLEPFAAIIAHKDDVGKRSQDAVYGGSAARTWQKLREWQKDGAVDFGLNVIEPSLNAVDADVLQEMIAPKMSAPVLMPAYVDLWSQTTPKPACDPDVGLFLHGARTSPEGIRIVWRADLPPDPERAVRLMALAPPRSVEALEISIYAARSWLGRLGDDGAPDLSDAPEIIQESPDREIKRPVLRWAGADSEMTGPLRRLGDLRPGDLIVVSTDEGGCDPYGWAPLSTDPVKDIGDEGQLGKRRVLRVAPALIEAQSKEEQERLAVKLAAVLAEAQDASAADLRAAILKLHLPGPIHQSLSDSRIEWRERRFPYDVRGSGATGVVFLGRVREGTDNQVPATEDDAWGSTPGFMQELDEHLDDVYRLALRFAEVSGIPKDIAGDVALAARLHDAGKADPRFQAMLYGGDVFATDDARLLAKSSIRGSDAWSRAGLPENWRHEALSVLMAKVHPEFLKANDPALVLWLIGTHHGWGRPFFPGSRSGDRDGIRSARVLGHEISLEAEAGPGSLAFEYDGRDWPGLFAWLKRRYGTWELARLEGLVRLADHRASESREAMVIGGATL